jgi:hypothetical protein
VKIFYTKTQLVSATESVLFARREFAVRWFIVRKDGQQRRRIGDDAIWIAQNEMSLCIAVIIVELILTR